MGTPLEARQACLPGSWCRTLGLCWFQNSLFARCFTKRMLVSECLPHALHFHKVENVICDTEVQFDPITSFVARMPRLVHQHQTMHWLPHQLSDSMHGCQSESADSTPLLQAACTAHVCVKRARTHLHVKRLASTLNRKTCQLKEKCVWKDKVQLHACRHESWTR